MKNQKSFLGWENKVPRVVKVLLILLIAASLSVPYCFGDNQGADMQKATSKNPNIALESPSSGGNSPDSVSPNQAKRATKILKLKVDSEGPSLGLQLVADGEISDYSVIPHDKNIVLEIPRVLLEEKQAAIPVVHNTQSSDSSRLAISVSTARTVGLSSR